MKKVAVLLFVFFCASILMAQELKMARISDSTYAWPTNLKGTYVNVTFILVNNKKWIYASAVGNDQSDGLIWRSKDRGKTWEHLTNGLGNVFFGGISSLYELNDTTILASGINGIWKSVDNGDIWQQTLSVTTGSGIWSFVRALNGNLFAGGNAGNGHIWESTDEGNSWAINPNIPDSLWPIDRLTMTDNGTLLASTNGVLRSTDNGNTWSFSNNGLVASDVSPYPRASAVTADVINNRTFVAYQNAKMYSSANQGGAWNEITNPGNSDVLNITTSTSYGILVGVDLHEGLYSSIDNGATWYYVGFSGSTVMSFGWLSSDTLLVGTSDGMYIAVLSVITDVPRETSGVPKNFGLSQNYPNPFNPSTKINYSVPKSSSVTLKVYDVLGGEVGTLVNEEKPAGSYSVDFNANNLPSGIYFYRIQAGNFSETKKMILIK